MDTCAKFLSTPFLVRSTSQLLSRTLLATVLKPPETPTDESLSSSAAPCPSTSIIPTTASEPALFQGTRTQQPSAMGWGCHERSGWLWGWNWDDVWEPRIGYARNPSLKQQLFSYAMLGFALSAVSGLFCPMVAFLILFAM